jgi:hypothetical protein
MLSVRAFIPITTIWACVSAWPFDQTSSMENTSGRTKAFSLDQIAVYRKNRWTFEEERARTYFKYGFELLPDVELSAKYAEIENTEKMPPPPAKAPSSVHPPGKAPSSVHPPGKAPSSVHPPGKGPSSVHPPGKAPSGVHPPGKGPSSVHPPGKAPSSVHPPGKAPSSVHPPGKAPSSVHPPRKGPSSVHPPGKALSKVSSSVRTFSRVSGKASSKIRANWRVNELEFVLNVRIGQQSLHLDPDTGSSDL